MTLAAMTASTLSAAGSGSGSVVEHRLVVFTGDPSFSVRKGIVDLDQSIPGLQWLVVWHTPHRSVARLLKNQRANIKRNGWRWIPYQLSEAFGQLLRRGSIPTAASAPGQEYTLGALCARPNLRLLRTTDLHADTALEEVRRFNPELGLSLAAPILRRVLFSLPALGTLNLHKGKLPEYRGMPPAFWEIWNDQSEVGCTVHWVDDKLDTGHVVAYASVQRARFATVKALQLELDEVGVALMIRAAADVLNGQALATAQAPYDGKTNRKPTLGQTAEMSRRERRNLESAGTVAPRWLSGAKRVAASAARLSLRGFGARLMAPRVTVLLYHRVSDEVRDNLTVGVAQFDEHMALLRRHCHLVSIEQVLSMVQVPRSKLPLVAVTFDDGYLDNYRHAVPILRRHAVPAAFFVSTGIVASDQRFPHDVRRGNPWIPVMNWDQLREMRRWGFTIGSHTVGHIDCAAESEALVKAELVQSRDNLRCELGLDEVILAYPYGGRQNMTAERLDWVRQAGYSGCLSAYGGSNIGTVDRFNVLRRGIHWEFTGPALLYQCLGL